MISSRAMGIGLLVIGGAIALGGLAELGAGHLLLNNSGKHPWLGRFLPTMLGEYASITSAVVAFTIASVFIHFGVRAIAQGAGNEPEKDA